MRLFVGIELADEMKSAVDAAASRLRAALLRSTPQLDARWVDLHHIHVTLWFIGEEPDDRARAIVSSLEPPLATQAFDLAVGGFGAFPPSGPPRVIWLGVARGGDELRSLHAEIGARLQPLGFEPEPRPYTGHLTIARVKDPRRARGRDIRTAAAGFPDVVATSRVDTVTLFRSRLSPKGAQHEPILRIPLK
jgi:RNA 2',3'-cyclic 3'-phosphodiesterase